MSLENLEEETNIGITTPEHRCWAEVVRQAIFDNASGDAEVAVEAREWLFDGECEEEQGSLKWICFMLDANIKLVRDRANEYEAHRSTWNMPRAGAQQPPNTFRRER